LSPKALEVYEMRCVQINFFLFTVILLESCASGTRVSNSNARAPEAQLPDVLRQIEDLNKRVEPSPEIVYETRNLLRYGGYNIRKLSKTVRLREVGWQGLTNVEYAVIKKNDSVIAKFDVLRHPLGTSARIGLFSFLGGSRKQLVIEQTLPRAWAYWIVDLAPPLRVVYDSTKYNLGHELSPEDIDGDGTYEFWQSLFTFWFFDRLCGACSPRIGIIFKYDPKTKKYLPANHLFQQRVLEGIKEDIARVEQVNKTTDFTTSQDPGGEYLSKVMMVIIPYIYAGKEKEAWSFYDREYRDEGQGRDEGEDQSSTEALRCLPVHLS
jgi:hypothetical protein